MGSFRKKLRVLLLTDSLGCPREEISVDNMWTDRILSEFGDNFTFYTSCNYGLSAKTIPMSYIGYLKPDFIICQMGIVDACRRALTVKEENIISKIPYFGRIVRKFCSKKHYMLTRIRDVHYADSNEFIEAIDSLRKLAGKRLALLEIAPPGKFLIDRTFNVINDVSLYNDLIFSKENPEDVDVIKPYSDSGILDCDEYLLKSDGHHLNVKGNDLVYKAVKDYLLTLN